MCKFVADRPRLIRGFWRCKAVGVMAVNKGENWSGGGESPSVIATYYRFGIIGRKIQLRK